MQLRPAGATGHVAAGRPALHLLRTLVEERDRLQHRRVLHAAEDRVQKRLDDLVEGLPAESRA